MGMLQQLWPKKFYLFGLSTLGCIDSEFFEEMGFFFIEFVGQFGYGDVLALLGRNLRDFLNGLDNLHEYLKYSYPRYLNLEQNLKPILAKKYVTVYNFIVANAQTLHKYKLGIWSHWYHLVFTQTFR